MHIGEVRSGSALLDIAGAVDLPVPRTGIGGTRSSLSYLTHTIEPMRRLALVAAAFLLAASPALAAGRLHVVLRGQDHHPRIGKRWHYSVRVTDAKTARAVACRIHLQFLFGKLPVGQIGTHVVRDGFWQETFGAPGNPAFPPAARGQHLTIEAVVTAKGYAKATATWWIVPR